MPLLVRRLQEAAAPHRARIVDQDVEPAALLLDGLRNLVGGALAQQVSDDHMRLAARRLDLGRDTAERRLIARRERDRASAARQCERNAAPDPAASPGDQRRLALELQVHF